MKEENKYLEGQAFEVSISAARNLLKALLLAHLLLFVKWKYYLREGLFVYPLTDYLEGLPTNFHYLVFLILILCVLAYLVGFYQGYALLIVGGIFLYFILGDLFLYHHDIFLGANIYILFGLLLIRFEQHRSYNYLLLALRILLSAVMFFSFFHKVNPDFHNGLLLRRLISNNTLFLKFTDPSESELVALGTPYLAKATILLEFLLSFILWTRYRYYGAAIGLVLHFGICFFSGFGVMFNMYVPFLYLFFIPLQLVPVPDLPRFWALKKVDFYGGLEITKEMDRSVVNSRTFWINLAKKFLPVNPFFVLLSLLFFFNTARIVYNILLP